MTCELCGRDAGAGVTAYGCGLGCDAEFGRRVEAGTCVACGEADAARGALRCAGCLGRSAPYAGYADLRRGAEQRAGADIDAVNQWLNTLRFAKLAV